MTSKHTPGPWRTSAFGDEVTTSRPGTLELSKRIADCSNPFLSHDEVTANACMVSAVPELLQALQDALQTAEFEQQGYRPWHDSARAAIAKAKGQ